jgi:ribonuclease VapC
VVNGEPKATDVVEACMSADELRMSTATWVEVFAAADRRDPAVSARLEALIDHLGVQLESVTATQAQRARQAYREFGRGRHRAGLNYGDCFAYALARDLDDELLFVGEDFRHTDIRSAL